MNPKKSRSVKPNDQTNFCDTTQRGKVSKEAGLKLGRTAYQVELVFVWNGLLLRTVKTLVKRGRKWGSVQTARLTEIY